MRWLQIAGFGMNIVLDYLFVWVMQLGMAGAAWAVDPGAGCDNGGLFCLCMERKAAGIGRL